ncbi:MAG TPA: energy-coupling factor transporter ATPase [Clostridia bacterium]
MSILIENLSYVYMAGTPYEKKALDNINLKIDNGEFVAIIGHTGSGKTTLVQHLNGLIMPQKGQILIDGKKAEKASLKELRRKVGIVFQYPESQLFEETVRADIAFGLNKLGLNKGELDSRINDAVKIVGLDKKILEVSPFELSGGQKRRVAIAGVISMEPEILILDEPAAGLDPKGKREIMEFIEKIHKERNITVILISHSMDDVAKLAKRVVVMKNGTILSDGETRKILGNIEFIESMGLIAPQITYLMRELGKRFPGIRKDILNVDEAYGEILKYIKDKE